MRNALDLDTSVIVQIWERLLEKFNGCPQFRVGSVVTDCHAKTVTWIINHAGGTDSVEDEIRVLLTAGDEDVDGGRNITAESQLFSFAAADCCELPELMDWRCL